MNVKKILCLIVAAAMLAGCSGTELSITAAEPEATAEAAALSGTDDNALTVQVQSIEGAVVTAVVGTLAAQTPPDMSGGAQNGQKPDGTAPDKPDGEAPSAQGGEAPDKPDGEAPDMSQDGMGLGGFTAGDEIVCFTVTDATAITKGGPSGQSEAGLSDISVDSILSLVLDGESNALTIVIYDGGTGGAPAQGGQSGFGGSESVSNGTAAAALDADAVLDGGEYFSTGDDENALRIDGASVTLENAVISKTAGESSNTENGDFYGMNAALLALGGASVTLRGLSVSSSAKNGNGVFSYGDGTTVSISDSVIRTTGNNSGGIQTTGGGTMNAVNLDILTDGDSSAAIRSDRGGGTVTVDGGSYITNGTGSPAVYSTASISVANALLTANASEAVVVEGKNSVALTDCVLSGCMSGTYQGDADENIHAVMIYQSMSGDAEVGEASFSMTGGSLTSLAGDLFYVTNTNCAIALNRVALTLANDVFLRIEGNSGSRGWGAEGENGGQVVLTATAQTLSGQILVDDISSLTLTLGEGSAFTGCINPDGDAGAVELTLGGGSVWKLSADSYISSFTGDLADVDMNGFTLYIGGVAQ